MNLKTKIYNISKIYTWNNHKNKLDIEHNKDILIENDKIIDISNEISNYDNAINGKNCIVTPGFIDSHTHPIFINHRSKEFLMRLEGKSYEEISNSGGGIISSVNNVRSSSEKELYNSAFKNIKPFLSFGTTTVEAKSGYGLTLFDEIKSLINFSGEYKSDILVNECLCGNISQYKKIVSELYSSTINQILLLRVLSNKIHRLLRIKEQENKLNNLDNLVNSCKPPIFWKEKSIVKKQLSIWSLNDLEKIINDINNTELLCKKNPQISNSIFFNFFSKICVKANNYS